MIEKKIHFVWVGSPLPEEHKKRIDGWRRLCSDFEFFLWDESNIDFSDPYIQKSYDLKLWSNLSNLARVKALYEHGGIYLDADIMMVKPLHSLLNEECFFGFQKEKHPTDLVNNAVIGAVKGHWFIKELIESIQKEFDGAQAPTLSGPKLVTKKLLALGLPEYSDKEVMVKDIKVFPIRFFYPFDWNQSYSSDLIHSDTYVVHLWERSWRQSYWKNPHAFRKRAVMKIKQIWREKVLCYFK